MKTIKTEEVYLGGYETFTDIIHAIPHFIDEVNKNAGPTPRSDIGALSSSRISTSARL